MHGKLSLATIYYIMNEFDYKSRLIFVKFDISLKPFVPFHSVLSCFARKLVGGFGYEFPSPFCDYDWIKATNYCIIRNLNSY